MELHNTCVNHVYYINLIGFVPASALFLYPYSDIAVHSSTNLQHVEHIGIGEVMVVLSIFDMMYLYILMTIFCRCHYHSLTCDPVHYMHKCKYKVHTHAVFMFYYIVVSTNRLRKTSVQSHFLWSFSEVNCCVQAHNAHRNIRPKYI